MPKWPPKVATLSGPYKLKANEAGELHRVALEMFRMSARHSFLGLCRLTLRLAFSRTQAIRAGVLVLLAAKVAV